MSRFLLTTCLLSLLSITSSGCFCCGWIPPCGVPMGGCFEGPCCSPRMSLCERRELRRALRGPGLFSGCVTDGCSPCNGGFGGGMYDGFATGDMTSNGGMAAGGQCPTCQQQMPMQMQMGQPMSTPMPVAPQINPVGPPASSVPVPSPVPTTSTQVQPMSGQYYSPPPAAFLPGVQPTQQMQQMQMTQPAQQMMYAP